MSIVTAANQYLNVQSLNNLQVLSHHMIAGLQDWGSYLAFGGSSLTLIDFSSVYFG